MNIVASVHEGFYNAPKLYGSNVRKPGKVTDFTSGVKEAGKVDIFLTFFLFQLMLKISGSFLWVL